MDKGHEVRIGIWIAMSDVDFVIVCWKLNIK